MIQLASALPITLAAPPGPALRVESAASNFALALASLSPPQARPAALPISEADPLAGWQPIAAPGKDLPEGDAETEPAPEDDTDIIDDEPALAWLTLPVPPQVPTKIPAASPAPVTATSVDASAASAAAPTLAAEPISDPAFSPEPALPTSKRIEPVSRREKVVALPSGTAKTTELPVAAPTPASAPAAAPVALNAPVAAASAASLVMPAVSLPATARPAALKPPVMRDVLGKAAPVADPATAQTLAAPVPAALETLAAPAQTAPAAEPVPVEPASAPSSASAAMSVRVVVPSAPEPQTAAAAATVPADPEQPTVQPSLPRALAAAAQPAPIRIAPSGSEPAALAQPLPTTASLFAAQIEQAASPRRSPSGAFDAIALAAGETRTSAAAPVTMAAETQHAPLDMRRQEWTGRMIEVIESLRDAGPVRETRLSLIPEALGRIDVTVRHDGDRIHVHITAETQAARQLIADAQPRLAEIAEQRGIKLGQTSVDSNGAGAGSGQQRDPARTAQPLAPRSARTEANPSTDDRIA